MNKYAVVIERGDTSYGAYVPDLPGCIAVGKTKTEVERLIAEAISLHIESLVQHGEPVPAPTSEIEYIEPAVLI
jgi:predicted RNase H-like HicB family nuclease